MFNDMFNDMVFKKLLLIKKLKLCFSSAVA